MSKTIKLNDKWQIRVDSYNFIPEKWNEESVVKAGKYAGQVIPAGFRSIDRYYGTFEQAIMGIFHHESFAQVEGQNVEEYVAQMKQVADDLMKAVRSIKV